MDLRRLPFVASLFAVLACVGGGPGEESGSAATVTGEATGEATVAATGEATESSGSASSSTASSSGETSGTTTLGPDECLEDEDCGGGLLCIDGYCEFCANVGALSGLDPASLEARQLRCSCGEATIELPLLAPNLVLIVDKSESMASQTVDDDLDPNTPEVSRWSLLYSAIEALIEVHDTTINLGLALLPGEAATNAYDISACATSEDLEVSVAYENGVSIFATLPPKSTPTLAGATPTGAAIGAAIEHFGAIQDGRDQAILLFSDGAANCDPEAVDEASRFEAVDGSVVQRVAAAHGEGIRTFVVGLDAAQAVAPVVVDGEPDGVNPSEFLAEVALAGGGHPYVNASDRAALDGAVSAVAAALLPCVLDLDPSPIWPDEVTVESGGVDYGKAIEGECEDADGWRFVDAEAEQIELCGVACLDARKVGSVEVYYHCGPSSG